jgi:hypothetical protein
MTEARHISPWAHPEVERAAAAPAKPKWRNIIRVVVPLLFLLVWAGVLAATAGSGVCDSHDPSHHMTIVTK